MIELKENVYKKVNSKDEADAIFENNFMKKISIIFKMITQI
jgi:hypothetical protein